MGSWLCLAPRWSGAKALIYPHTRYPSTQPAVLGTHKDGWVAVGGRSQVQLNSKPHPCSLRTEAPCYLPTQSSLLPPHFFYCYLPSNPQTQANLLFGIRKTSSPRRSFCLSLRSIGLYFCFLKDYGALKYWWQSRREGKYSPNKHIRSLRWWSNLVLMDSVKVTKICDSDHSPWGTEGTGRLWCKNRPSEDQPNKRWTRGDIAPLSWDKEWVLHSSMQEKMEISAHSAALGAAGIQNAGRE